MTVVSWIPGSTEQRVRLVGRGNTIYPDTLNAPLRQILSLSGFDPDSDFPGFVGRPSGIADGQGLVYDAASQLFVPTDIALQGDLDTLDAALSSHIADVDNPHDVTAAQVGALTQLTADVRYPRTSYSQFFDLAGDQDLVPVFVSIASSGTNAINILVAVPLVIPTESQLNKFVVIADPIGSSDSAGIVGLYEDTGAMYPGNKISDTGALALTANPLIVTVVSPPDLDPGMVWLVFNQNDAVTDAKFLSTSGGTLLLPNPISMRQVYSSYQRQTIYRSGSNSWVYNGTLPSTFPTGVSGGGNAPAPIAAIRIGPRT